MLVQSQHALSLTVLIDARNVLRSRWPNIPEDELVRLIGEWAAEEGVEPEIVFDGRAPEGGIGTGGESADDWIARRAASSRTRTGSSHPTGSCASARVGEPNA